MTLYSDDDEEASTLPLEEGIEDTTFLLDSSDLPSAYTQADSSATFGEPPSELFGSDSSSASDGDMDTDYEESDDFDDQVSVENYISDQPYYSEYDDDLNVLHGAYVAGFSSLQARVDLEIFLAEDEEEVEELPEMQMAVDRESFEHWCEFEEAVDIELDGARLRCTGELFDSEEFVGSSSDEDEDMDILVYE